jgi:hypothetical protein
VKHLVLFVGYYLPALESSRFASKEMGCINCIFEGDHLECMPVTGDGG